MPFGVDTELFNPNVKPINVKGRKNFMFITNGDYTERKWFEGLIESFVKEFNGDEDVFVFKINSNGSDLLFSTFIGGNQDDWSRASMYLDALGGIYVSGRTPSTNFPTTIGAFQNGFSKIKEWDHVKKNHLGFMDVLGDTYTFRSRDGGKRSRYFGYPLVGTCLVQDQCRE